jgi:hypothetical protein
MTAIICKALCIKLAYLTTRHETLFYFYILISPEVDGSDYVTLFGCNNSGFARVKEGGGADSCPSPYSNAPLVDMSETNSEARLTDYVLLGLFVWFNSPDE